MVDDELRYAYRCLGFTGVRRGESLGWENRDVVHGVGGIRQINVQRAYTTVRERSKKSDHSMGSTKAVEPRVVVLDDYGKAAIEGQRRMLASMGPKFLAARAPLIALADGSRPTPDMISKRFDRAVSAYNWAHRDQPELMVTRVVLQGLRHSHATHLLQAGVHPKVVQERFGHSDIRVTMKTYSHVIDSVQVQAISRFSDFVGTQSIDENRDEGNEVGFRVV